MSLMELGDRDGRSATLDMAPPRLLLIDELPSERGALADYLRARAFSVVECDHVADLEVEADGLDVVVIVASLPDPSVSAFIRRAAERGGPPVLVMSETAEYVERVLALELGADDLVAREINPRELLARLRGLLRRSRREMLVRPRHAGPEWTLDPGRRALLAPSGRRIDLSRTDLALLTAFAEGPDCQILDADAPGGSLRTAVSRLRHRVLDRAQIDLPIRNVRGVGYRFEAPISVT